MIDAVMYGMMPSANTDKRRILPPANRSKNPKMPPDWPLAPAYTRAVALLPLIATLPTVSVGCRSLQRKKKWSIAYSQLSPTPSSLATSCGASTRSQIGLAFLVATAWAN